MTGESDIVDTSHPLLRQVTLVPRPRIALNLCQGVPYRAYDTETFGASGFGLCRLRVLACFDDPKDNFK